MLRPLSFLLRIIWAQCVSRYSTAISLVFILLILLFVLIFHWWFFKFSVSVSAFYACFYVTLYLPLTVKVPGSQSFPGTAHISPQCGLKGKTQRGRICNHGVGTGVMNCGNPHLSRSMEGSLLTPIVFNKMCRTGTFSSTQFLDNHFLLFRNNQLAVCLIKKIVYIQMYMLFCTVINSNLH